MKLKLAQGSDPILKEAANVVIHFDDELRQFVRDMYETMIAERGMGLAANQVNDARQIIVTKVDDKELTLINPMIITRKGETATDEGCLSYPDITVRVVRPDTITVTYQDEYGDKHWDKEFTGILAVCIQHEIDHLNGKTFLHYVSRQQRRLIEREIDKKKGK